MVTLVMYNKDSLYNSLRPFFSKYIHVCVEELESKNTNSLYRIQAVVLSNLVIYLYDCVFIVCNSSHYSRAIHACRINITVETDCQS